MDNYRNQVMDLHNKQSAKGFSKYGQAMEQSDLETVERLQYLAEELMDGLHYVFSVMEKLTPLAPITQEKIIKNCDNCRFLIGRIGCSAAHPCYNDREFWQPKAVD
jgi:hypothetical protein